MMGHAEPGRPRVRARAAHDFGRRVDGRLYIERVVLTRADAGGFLATRSGVQASNVLSGMARRQRPRRCSPTATVWPRATSSPCSCSTLPDFRLRLTCHVAVWAVRPLSTPTLRGTTSIRTNRQGGRSNTREASNKTWRCASGCRAGAP